MNKWILAFLLPLSLFGQVIPPPATQAEVDAGLNRFKYVTPFTLNNTVNTNVGGGGGSTSPGGSTAAVQFNQSGAFAGTNRFIYDRTNDTLTLLGGSAGSLQLLDNDGSHGVRLISPATLSSNQNITFPTGLSNGVVGLTSVNDSNFTVTVTPIESLASGTSFSSSNFIGSGSGLTNFLNTSRAGYPNGQNTYIMWGTSLGITPSASENYGFYLTNTVWPASGHNGIIVTNDSVSSRKLTTMLTQYPTSIRPWIQAYVGAGTNVIVLCEFLNHDIANGTNAVEQFLQASNAFRLITADGAEALFFTAHSYTSEQDLAHHEKQKCNQMVFDDLDGWSWVYPFDKHFGSLPIDYLSTDAIHPASNGARKMAHGVDKVLRSGRRNPQPITEYLPQRGVFSGSGGTAAGFSVDHTVLIRDNSTPSLIIQNTDDDKFLRFVTFLGSAYIALQPDTGTGHPYQMIITNNGIIFPTNLFLSSTLGYDVRTVSGTGGALTNFTINALASGRSYLSAATNVNIVAVMNSSTTRQYPQTLIITNRTATPRTFSLGAITNNFIPLDSTLIGLVAPVEITNALWAEFETLGTNVYYRLRYIANPTN